MLFSLENRANGNKTHCGVLEFIAEEGCVYMPYWVCPNCLCRAWAVAHVRWQMQAGDFRGSSTSWQPSLSAGQACRPARAVADEGLMT